MARNLAFGLLVVGMMIGVPSVVGDDAGTTGTPEIVELLSTYCQSSAGFAERVCRETWTLIRHACSQLHPGTFTGEHRSIPLNPDQNGNYRFQIPLVANTPADPGPIDTNPSPDIRTASVDATFQYLLVSVVGEKVDSNDCQLKQS